MRITEAEACVMEAVWSAGPAGLPAADLLARLCPAHRWSESTARTLIHRLMLKGALSSTRLPGGGAVYAPTVTREAAQISLFAGGPACHRRTNGRGAVKVAQMEKRPEGRRRPAGTGAG